MRDYVVALLGAERGKRDSDDMTVCGTGGAFRCMHAQPKQTGCRVRVDDRNEEFGLPVCRRLKETMVFKHK